MFGPWIKLKVKPIGSASVARLDDALNDCLSALVEQQLANGRWFHQPASDGTYSVRVLDPSPLTVNMVKAFIGECGFEIISETRHEK